MSPLEPTAWAEVIRLDAVGFIAIASDLIERSVLQELQPWLMELNQTPRPGCKEAEGGSKESTEFMSLAAAFLDESPKAISC